MAFILPTVIVFIVLKEEWAKTIAALTWFAGFLISAEIWLLYLITTAIWYPIVAVIVWLIRRAIAAKRHKRATEYWKP